MNCDSYDLICTFLVDLAAFTGYSMEFVSAIAWNMLNNRLWTDRGYESFRMAASRRRD
jgi:hypothetical protein